MPLYRCISCGRDFSMRDKGSVIYCTHCGEKWEMSEYGQLVNQKSGNVIHIPNWYSIEREKAEQEAEDDGYCCEFSVRVEALPNERGFVELGEGRLIHNKEGFTLDVKGQRLFFPTRTLPSVQTEYNYKGRGKCVVLSTRDCCYYAYCSEDRFNPTKLQFAAERLYLLQRKKRKTRGLRK